MYIYPSTLTLQGVTVLQAWGQPWETPNLPTTLWGNFVPGPLTVIGPGQVQAQHPEDLGHLIPLGVCSVNGAAPLLGFPSMNGDCSSLGLPL